MDKTYYLENRERLINEFKRRELQTDSAFIILKGSKVYPEYNADTNYYPIKYEENIQYLFGIRKEGVDAMLNLQSGESYLIGDDLNPDDFFYSKNLNEKDAKEIYGVNRFLYKSQLKDELNSLNPQKIYIYKGIDTYSRHWSNFYDDKVIVNLFNHIIDEDTLFPVLNELRCIKTEKELKYFKEICKISSDAHIYTMQSCLPGMKEYQISAIFKDQFSQHFGQDDAYDPVCGANRNGSWLHYTVNTDTLKNGKLILCDMGAQKGGICSDITCTYPINGKFTFKQKQVYEIVLKTQTDAISCLKEGASYKDIQVKAYKTILLGLKELGILLGDVNDMYEKLIHKIFMPHRLGHYIGYRTHDVGLQKKEGADKEDKKGFYSLDECESLRAGMTLTVEPGIYFIETLINKSKEEAAKFYIDYDKLALYTSEIGGIRIEDDLIVTKDGYYNCTICPRTVQEIETCMERGDLAN